MLEKSQSSFSFFFLMSRSAHLAGSNLALIVCPCFVWSLDITLHVHSGGNICTMFMFHIIKCNSNVSSICAGHECFL